MEPRAQPEPQTSEHSTPAGAVDDVLGRVLGGRYRVRRLLKKGGMGAVYLADDDNGGSPVAIKVVRPNLSDDASALARFKREMRLAKEIHHPNIVQTIDVGDDGGAMWMAMELLDGVTLRERIDRAGRLTWQESLPVVEQIVRALAAAHEKNICHRDLKPENVMLVDGPGGHKVVKLVDFGIAKQAHVGAGDSTHMTGTGLIVGTPGYVSPELILEGVTDDPRSDFYALGVTWFEMLTAAPPFTAKTPLALTMRHAHEAPPAPSTLLPYTPPPLPVERLIMRLLAKAPTDRPENAAALLALLARLANEAHVVVDDGAATATDLMGVNTGVVPFARTPMPPSPSPLPSSPSPSPSSSSSPSLSQPTPAAMLRAMPRSWLGGAVAGLALVVTAAVFVGVRLSPQRTEEPPVSTSTSTSTPSPSPSPSPSLADPYAPRSLALGVPSSEMPSAKPVGPVEPVEPVPVVPVGSLAAPQRDTKPARPPRPPLLPPPPPPPPHTPPPHVQALATTLVVSPKPVSAGWRVSIDGQFAVETPITRVTTPGAHTLTFTSRDGKQKVVRTVELNVGPNRFVENLGP